MKQEKIYIYGKHALTEALQNSPHVIKKVYLAPQASDAKLTSLIKRHNIPTATLGSDKGARDIEESASHQGVIGVVGVENLMTPFADFAKDLKVTSDTALVLLDELQDPHNVGAIIRSAAAFGISGILFPEHNQVQVTGAVVKVSAGMAFRVPLVRIGNVNMTIRELKEKGFWIYGLDETAKVSVDEEKFDAPAVFVLGNESKGIRQKTSELCDIPLAIPIHPRCESLNVAASAAIALYEWSTKHPGAVNKGK